MKVLMVHNFYQSALPSGEDVVFKNEVELLKRHGIDVITYTRHNDEIINYNNFNKLNLTFENIWSKRTYFEIKELIKKNMPDVAHFHNIWYLVSPAAYYACKASGIPVIQSLHNQRMFCPKATIYRKGNVCTLCLNKFFPIHALKNKCYRNSLFKTAALSSFIAIHNILNTWKKAVDIYIVFTEFFKNKFIEWGLPPHKIVVKPHFVYPDPGCRNQSIGQYALFIGRLDQEKGINTLISAWDNLSFPPLVIRGNGKMQLEVNQLAARNPSVRLVSHLSRPDLFKLIKSARFLIWPSNGWYENFGLVAIESFACGVPIIASKTGAMSEIVEHMKTGLLFEPGNSEDLVKKVKWMVENEDKCIQMGKNARREFEKKYTAERNFKILIDIYRKAIQVNKIISC